jgi:hypothetical protein
MLVAIDADILVYKILHRMQPVFYFVDNEYFSTKKEAIAGCEWDDTPIEDIVKIECVCPPWMLEKVVKECIESTEARITAKLSGEVSEFLYVFSGKDNFRKTVDPMYKANRPPKPVYANIIKNLLVDHTNGVRVDRCEADDVLAVLLELGPNTCIASTDKDLRNIPGTHYNLDTGKLLVIEPQTGFKSFITQVITGDTVDNIAGIRGVGLAGAAKILKETNLTGPFSLQWESFLLALSSFCEDKKKVFDWESVSRDTILLDVGGYWMKQIGIEHPETGGALKACNDFVEEYLK